MNPKTSGIFIVIMVAATFITGAIAYPQIGDFRLAFGLPMAMLVLWGLWALLPAIDPIAKGFHGFRYIYDFVWILLMAFLAYAYSLVLESALGLRVDGFRMIMPAMAVLFFVIGALLPRIKRNWFFGVRTPWTLSSDDDWAKTHKFAGPLFMIAALFILVGAFVPREWSIGFIIVPVLLAALASVVYSYLVFRRGHENR